MSYQVLARKYRPRTFAELIGQEQVTRTLRHALDQNRLHHAYLFTGTRGVGKTTLARILARCLNCEQGISAEPCGECTACQTIDEGRFVDLIEVDAASRTKVEDTRDLLDNVQYAPSMGRFKVYLIDEVHMLSSHSFNALLKTLEEPPPHVKFLLATTDPQKLPITVLSRCLQFNLKMLPADLIAGYLAELLQKESIGYDDAALPLLGRAASGSMRDALSLTDQAIAFGDGKIIEDDVRGLLGSVDREHVLKLIAALAEGKPKGLLACMDDIFCYQSDALALLDELISHLHQLAVQQVVPDRGDQRLQEWAGRFHAEEIQLYYDIAVKGRSDLANLSDGRAALEMLLLRMLLFRPEGVLTTLEGTEPGETTSQVEDESSPRQQGGAPTSTEEEEAVKKPEAPVKAPEPEAKPEPEPEAKPELASKPEPALPEKADAVAIKESPQALSELRETAPTAPSTEAEPSTSQGVSLNDWWCDLLPRLQLEGTIHNLAANCELVERDDQHWVLALPDNQRIWDNPERRAKLTQAISDYFNKPVSLDFRFDGSITNTPHARAEQRRQAVWQEARESIVNDPRVQQLIDTFGASVDEASIQLFDEEAQRGI